MTWASEFTVKVPCQSSTVDHEEADDQAGPAGDEVGGHAEGPRRDPVVLGEEPQLGVLGEVLDRVRVPALVLVAEDPADVAPPEALERRVDVALGVAEAVVVAVVAGPPEGALLGRHAAAEGEDELERAARLVGAVGEVAVVAGGDEPHAPEVEDGAEGERPPGHTGDEGQQAGGVDQEHRDRGGPVDPLVGGALDGVGGAHGDVLTGGVRGRGGSGSAIGTAR